MSRDDNEQWAVCRQRQQKNQNQLFNSQFTLVSITIQSLLSLLLHSMTYFQPTLSSRGYLSPFFSLLKIVSDIFLDYIFFYWKKFSLQFLLPYCHLEEIDNKFYHWLKFNFELFLSTFLSEIDWNLFQDKSIGDGIVEILLL